MGNNQKGIRHRWSNLGCLGKGLLLVTCSWVLGSCLMLFVPSTPETNQEKTPLNTTATTSKSLGNRSAVSQNLPEEPAAVRSHHSSSSDSGEGNRLALPTTKPVKKVRGKPSSQEEQKYVSAFFEAIKKSDLEKITKMLEEYPRLVNADEPSYASVLIWAAKTASSQVLEYLIINGADIESQSSVASGLSLLTDRFDINYGPGRSRGQAGDTALHVAAALNKPQHAALLIAYGADVHARTDEKLTPRTNEGLTPLQLTGDPRTAEYLLAHGADPNIQDEHGKTLFHYVAAAPNRSVFKTRYSMAKVLLKYGASLTVRDNDFETPIDKAKNADGVMKALFDYWQNGESGLLAIPLESAFSDPEILNDVLESGLDPNGVNAAGETPLQMAAALEVKSSGRMGGVIEPMQILLEHGANPSVRDADGRTLFYSVMSGYTSSLEAARLLLQHGAKITMDIFLDRVAIAGAGHFGDLEFLVENGADINMQDEAGVTPLIFAVAKKKRAETVKFLLEKGANPNLGDEKGRTPLHYACLVRANRDIFETLLQGGSSIHGETIDGLTPLAILMFTDSPNHIEFLLSLGSDPNAQCKNGRTPIHWAARNQYRYQYVEQLLKHAGNINAQDKKGYTPLHVVVAEFEGSETQGCSLLAHLVRMGANPLLKDKTGKTPLDLALACDKKNYAETLKIQLEQMKL